MPTIRPDSTTGPDPAAGPDPTTGPDPTGPDPAAGPDSAADPDPTTDPDPATGLLRAAMQARDLDAVVDCFAPDAVFRSPLTDRLAFTGHAQIRALTQVLLEVLTDLCYDDQAAGPGTAILTWHARIGGQPIEGVDQLRFRLDGKIQEFTVFFRPLPAAAVALRVIGTGLARRRHPARAVAVSALTQPLAVLSRVGDRVGVRLVGSSLG